MSIITTYKAWPWYKKAGLWALLFLLLIAILGIIIPKEVKFSKTGHIKATPSFVFNLLEDVKTTPSWNSWVVDDKEIKLTYGDTTLGSGARYSWSSPSSGDGSIVLLETEKDKLIKARMDFMGDNDNIISYNLSPRQDGTTDLTWSMDSKMGFPYNLLKGIFRWQMNKSYKASMANMNKVLSERQANKYFGYNLKEVPMNERHYVMSRSEIDQDKMTMFFSQNLGAIFTKVQNENIIMDGMPSALIFKTDRITKKVDMAAAIPVKARIDIAQLSSITMPAAPAIVADYYGNYDSTYVAHDAIRAYLKDRNLKPITPNIEEHMTDPLIEKDTKKWLTKVMYYYSL